MAAKVISLGQTLVGPGQKVFVIAEAGVNHNGELALAKQLVDVAVAAGADAFKIQTFTADMLVTASAAQAEYQTKNIGKSESQLAMLKRLEFSQDNHRSLQSYCQARGIMFLSTPFSEPDADFLETLQVPAYKIPSGEITNIPFLKQVARKGKPMIVSTGMADMAETRAAISAITEEGNSEIIILHSTSNYPPSFESLNLRALTTLARAFPEYPIGYSDNGSEGVVADIVAAALGATVIEKHFTLDKSLPGPDHKASLDPVELAAMVKGVRSAEVMLGDGNKQCTPEEEAIRLVARKSIVSRRAILAGETLAVSDFIMKRPGTGLPPVAVYSLVGKKARRAIPADTLVTSEDYEK